MKYLSIVRRLGKNRAIVAIARIMVEAIYVMLSGGMEFVDSIDSLTEQKMKAMSARAKNPQRAMDLKETIKFIKRKQLGGMSKELFSFTSKKSRC